MFDITHAKELIKETDYHRFQQRAQVYLQDVGTEDTAEKWQLFAHHLNDWSERKPEKLMVMQLAFGCFTQSVSTTDLAQLITQAMHLKAACGLRIFKVMFESITIVLSSVQDTADNPTPLIELYLMIMQLLVDLSDKPRLFNVIRETLPDLSALSEQLQIIQDQKIAALYPTRNIDSVLAGFLNSNYPLDSEYIESIKMDYLALSNQLVELKRLPQESLKASFLKAGQVLREEQSPSARQLIIAIIVETIRRLYKIKPYDTQVITLLAMLNKKPGTKGRIGQIKTGEGKSTMQIMLAAFLGIQRHFIFMVTSSEYLAMRDLTKYKPFFETLGLSFGHVCYKNQQPWQFQPQILIGTNSNYQFALLRDGLYNTKLLHSRLVGSDQLVPRTWDVALIDEIDNMFLDSDGSSRIAARKDKDPGWAFQAIYDFVYADSMQAFDDDQTVRQLRLHIEKNTKNSSESFNNVQLKTWMQSAYIAIHKKEKGRDYLVKPVKKMADGRLIDDIVIVDFENTGRTSEGCQWGQGIHQFLQIHNRLELSPLTQTIGSISNVSFYKLFQELYGVTGTMGEKTEREEIQAVYGVDSFDAPPHFPSQREMLPATVFINEESQWEGILAQIELMQSQGRPSLILFRSVNDSNRFHQYLTEQGKSALLLNETQRESEDYIVARAGEPGAITIATNTGGRGTDIVLSLESKQARGLHQIFAFFPDNIRGEEQGFGRAGRQGQPGSCTMLLNREDPTILEYTRFIQGLSREELVLRQQLASKLIELVFEDYSSKIIKLLTAIRTFKVQRASERRHRHAEQETLYYEYLTRFFSEFRQLETSLKTEENQAHLMQAFQAEHPVVPFALEENNSYFRTLCKSIQLKTESAGDKLSLIKQFTQNYLDYARNEWANFYTELTESDKPGHLLYNQTKLPAILNTPVETALSCLRYLHQCATNQLVSSTGLQRYSMFRNSPICSSLSVENNIVPK